MKFRTNLILIALLALVAPVMGQEKSNTGYISPSLVDLPTVPAVLRSLSRSAQ